MMLLIFRVFFIFYFHVSSACETLFTVRCVLKSLFGLTRQCRLYKLDELTEFSIFFFLPVIPLNSNRTGLVLSIEPGIKLDLIKKGGTVEVDTKGEK